MSETPHHHPRRSVGADRNGLNAPFWSTSPHSRSSSTEIRFNRSQPVRSSLPCRSRQPPVSTGSTRTCPQSQEAPPLDSSSRIARCGSIVMCLSLPRNPTCAHRTSGPFNPRWNCWSCCRSRNCSSCRNPTSRNQTRRRNGNPTHRCSPPLNGDEPTRPPRPRPPRAAAYHRRRVSSKKDFPNPPSTPLRMCASTCRRWLPSERQFPKTS